MIWGYPQYCCSFSYCIIQNYIRAIPGLFCKCFSLTLTQDVELESYRVCSAHHIPEGGIGPQTVRPHSCNQSRVLQEPLQQIYHPTSIFQTHNSSGGCDLLLKQPQKPVIMAGMGTGLAPWRAVTQELKGVPVDATRSPRSRHLPGAGDAETPGHRRWEMHALLWRQVQAGAAVQRCWRCWRCWLWFGSRIR